MGYLSSKMFYTFLISLRKHTEETYSQDGSQNIMIGLIGPYFFIYCKGKENDFGKVVSNISFNLFDNSFNF